VTEAPRKPKADSCPICRKPAQPAFAPFCSARCADIDLGRWLSDRYVIPAEDEEADAPQGGNERENGSDR
jgi:endogenous inhibitor of DNA gyrase (YacG/DUF329 family)